LEFNELGHGSFQLEYNGVDLGSFQLSVPGVHNVYNATSAIAAAYVSGIDLDLIRTNISLYKGVGRRFEHKGKYNNATIVDDYAHHPTELKATLAAARKMCKGNLWCVFQPHTYTRTKSLLNEFSEAFFSADKVIITDIYAAREQDPGDIHSKDLADRLYQKNVDVKYIQTFEDIASFLCENIKENDLVITAGAGPIYQVAEMVVETSKNI